MMKKIGLIVAFVGFVMAVNMMFAPAWSIIGFVEDELHRGYDCGMLPEDEVYEEDDMFCGTDRNPSDLGDDCIDDGGNREYHDVVFESLRYNVSEVSDNFEYFIL